MDGGGNLKCSSSPRPPPTHPPPRPIHGIQMGPRDIYHYVRPTAAAKAGVPPPSIEEGVPMEPPTVNLASSAASEHANTTKDGRVGRSWRKWRLGKGNKATGTYLLPSSHALPRQCFLGAPDRSHVAHTTDEKRQGWLGRVWARIRGRGARVETGE